VIVLSANRAADGGSDLADIQEHLRRFIDAIGHGCFELVESRHVVEPEQPEHVAARVRELLPAT
jgi:hypothetical protein